MEEQNLCHLGDGGDDGGKWKSVGRRNGQALREQESMCNRNKEKRGPRKKDQKKDWINWLIREDLVGQRQ